MNHDSLKALALVKQQILATSGEWRGGAAVELVIVSQSHPVEQNKPLLHGRERHFGENRVQEAEEKWPKLRLEFDGIRLHLIEHLQRNKVREALKIFDVFESIDSPKLADEIIKECRSLNRNPPEAYIQVNIGEEPQKNGVKPQDCQKLLAYCLSVGLAATGLMVIPPQGKPAEPYFVRTAELAALLGLKKISMGMSDDYVQAIRSGATTLRIGSAIFGSRPRGGMLP